jgi:hypothetical protein
MNAPNYDFVFKQLVELERVLKSLAPGRRTDRPSWVCTCKMILRAIAICQQAAGVSGREEFIKLLNSYTPPQFKSELSTVLAAPYSEDELKVAWKEVHGWARENALVVGLKSMPVVVEPIQLFTAKQAAKLLNISPRTLWRHRGRRYPNSIDIGRRQPRWKYIDLKKFIEHGGNNHVNN